MYKVKRFSQLESREFALINQATGMMTKGAKAANKVAKKQAKQIQKTTGKNMGFKPAGNNSITGGKGLNAHINERGAMQDLVRSRRNPSASVLERKGYMGTTSDLSAYKGLNQGGWGSKTGKNAYDHVMKNVNAY